MHASPAISRRMPVHAATLAEHSRATRGVPAQQHMAVIVPMRTSGVKPGVRSDGCCRLGIVCQDGRRSNRSGELHERLGLRLGGRSGKLHIGERLLQRVA